MGSLGLLFEAMAAFHRAPEDVRVEVDLQVDVDVQVTAEPMRRFDPRTLWSAQTLWLFLAVAGWTGLITAAAFDWSTTAAAATSLAAGAGATLLRLSHCAPPDGRRIDILLR